MHCRGHDVLKVEWSRYFNDEFKANGIRNTQGFDSGQKTTQGRTVYEGVKQS